MSVIFPVDIIDDWRLNQRTLKNEQKSNTDKLLRLHLNSSITVRVHSIINFNGNIILILITKWPEDKLEMYKTKLKSV